MWACEDYSYAHVREVMMLRFQVATVKTEKTELLIIILLGAIQVNAFPTQEAASSKILGKEFQDLLNVEPTNFDKE
jgi:hypothetical protein